MTAFAHDPRKVTLTHSRLRVVAGDVLRAESVDAAMAGQDAVVSALGTRLPLKILIPIIVASQIVVRTVALSQPVEVFVELGVPVLAILMLSRRTTILSDGTRNIVQAMKRAGIARFVCESSLGVGDSKGKMGVLHNLITGPLYLRNSFADKATQEQIIAGSGLDWVIVRPGVLTSGPPRNVYRAGPDVGDGFTPPTISRADVAAFMLKQLTGTEYLRTTPGLAY